jgi:multicomponent Na+:H+ antiporter subunit B
LKEPKKSIVIETVSRVMVPFIQLFSLYVIIHGASGPGGGFQGGVIFGASLILYVIVNNLEKGRTRLPESVNTAFSSLGIYIYGGIGILAILFSCGAAQYLDYGFIPFSSHFVENRAIGMELVEIGIGITVMAIIASIFFDLAAGKEKKKGHDEEGTN